MQNIIMIPAILVASVSGARLYKAIMKDKRKENIKVEICKHTVFSGFILLAFLLSALAEAYISSNAMMIIINYL